MEFKSRKNSLRKSMKQIDELALANSVGIVSVVGMIEAFIMGFIFAYTTAWLYNKSNKRKGVS